MSHFIAGIAIFILAAWLCASNQKKNQQLWKNTVIEYFSKVIEQKIFVLIPMTDMVAASIVLNTLHCGVANQNTLANHLATTPVATPLRCCDMTQKNCNPLLVAFDPLRPIDFSQKNKSNSARSLKYRQVCGHFRNFSGAVQQNNKKTIVVTIGKDEKGIANLASGLCRYGEEPTRHMPAPMKTECF